MVLIYGWIIAVWAVALISVGFLAKKLGKKNKLKHTATTALRVAHSRRLIELPEYTRRLRVYQRWLIVALALVSIGLSFTIILSARPAKQVIVTPTQKNRDIMLCLDVSPSMKTVNLGIVDVFQSLVKSFDGQRIGLDVYNYNSSQLFPLTDDYMLARDQLAYAKKALSYDYSNSGSSLGDYAEISSFYSGTGIVVGSGLSLPASNTGIGLAGCLQHLGNNETGRSQSIILATDNELSGTESNAIVTTTQALLLAKKQGVRVYALDPGVSNDMYTQPKPDIADDSRGSHETLKTYSLMTGGGYYRLSSVDIVPDIVSKVSAQEAKLYTGASQYSTADTPEVWFAMLCVAIVGVSLASWRLKL